MVQVFCCVTVSFFADNIEIFSRKTRCHDANEQASPIPIEIFPLYSSALIIQNVSKIFH